ncbi:conserved protein of unknown function [Ectopseudomonas oleovorans]|uniref:Uncharacterized protein n=1 Tax=Ectopseudomonas oleovorans TaxID=301 RepID=A0A653B1J1_ECTOL|nr:conserved protein of unknown function [Pseudomonas oleovorans]
MRLTWNLSDLLGLGAPEVPDADSLHPQTIADAARRAAAGDPARLVAAPQVPAPGDAVLPVRLWRALADEPARRHAVGRQPARA